MMVTQAADSIQETFIVDTVSFLLRLTLKLHTKYKNSDILSAQEYRPLCFTETFIVA